MLALVVPFFPTLAATTAIMLLYWILIHLAARYELVGRWLKGRAVGLRGMALVDREAMQRAAVGADDLEESARQFGMGDLTDLKEAVLERNGKISIVARPSE